MERKVMYGFFAIAIIALAGISIAAAQGVGFGRFMSNGDYSEMQEHQDGIQQAVENKDFSAWKSAMEERISYMQSQITEDRFNEIVEMHEKMQEIREEIGSGNFSQMREQRGNFGMHERQGRPLENSQ